MSHARGAAGRQPVTAVSLRATLLLMAARNPPSKPSKVRPKGETQSLAALLKKYGYSAAQQRAILAGGPISDIRTFAMRTPPARFTVAFKEMMAGPAIRARRERRDAKRSEPAKVRAPQQSIADFSQDVNRLAKHATEGQWVGSKTFIDQVHKDYVRTHGDISADAFKQRLVDAARTGKILLSRADLVGAYPQHRLAASRISVGGEDYHMVEHGWLR